MARQHSSTLRFDDLREMTARFASMGACGHAIKQGERIAYGRGAAYCETCYRKWASEVQEENDYSDRYGSM
jgi:hypothetical protein